MSLGLLLKNSRKHVIAVAFISLSVLAALSFFRASQKSLKDDAPSNDLGRRWLTVNTILEGENPYQMRLTGDLSDHVKGLLQENPTMKLEPDYFPSALLPIIPFSFMMLYDAGKAWIIMNLICTFLLVLASFRMFVRERTWMVYLVVLLLLSGTPLRATITNGQMTTVALTFFILALFADRKNEGVLAGVFLALSLLKYALTGPLVLILFVFKRRWKALGVCVGIHVTMHMWMCSLMKVNPLTVIGETLECNAYLTNYVNFDICFDIWTFFNRIDGITGWGTVCKYMAGIILLVVIIWVATILRRDKEGKIDDLSLLSLASVIALFCIYHRNYDGVCLFFPLLWITQFKGHNGMRIVIGAGAAYFFIFQRLLWEISWRQEDLWTVIWITDAVMFFGMMYCVMRIIWDKTGENGDMRYDGQKTAIPRRNGEKNGRTGQSST